MPILTRADLTNERENPDGSISADIAEYVIKVIPHANNHLYVANWSINPQRGKPDGVSQAFGSTQWFKSRHEAIENAFDFAIADLTSWRKALGITD